MSFIPKSKDSSRIFEKVLSDERGVFRWKKWEKGIRLGLRAERAQGTNQGEEGVER